MTKFSITLEKDISETELYEASKNTIWLGRITIGDFNEDFHASTEYWTPEQYKSQWQEAIKRLQNGYPKSILITSMVNPDHANFIGSWSIYLDGNIVHFQNNYMAFDQLDSPFDENNPYLSISDREICNEDGEDISEWSIDLETITSFLKLK